MTKRLVDGPAPEDDVAAEVVRLLTLAPAGDPPTGAANRVRARLAETIVRRPVLPHRLVAVIAILLATTAIAGAWVVRTAWRARNAVNVTTAPTAPATTIAGPLAEPAPVVAVAPTFLAAVPESSVAMPPPAASSPVPVPPRRRFGPAAIIAPFAPALAPAPRSRISPAQPVAAGEAPAAPRPAVLQAVLVARARILLRQGEPQGALALVADYLRATPDGPVAEEAMALAIQANLALGDARAAVDAYLQRYPDGRFAAFAHGARDRDVRKLCSPPAIQCP